MYKLFPLRSLHDPEALWLSYDGDESFDNTEWRPCVEHFLKAVAARGHAVVPLPSPAFEGFRRGGVRSCVANTPHAIAAATPDPESACHCGSKT
jgi:hypothetical protein